MVDKSDGATLVDGASDSSGATVVSRSDDWLDFGGTEFGGTDDDMCFWLRLRF